MADVKALVRELRMLHRPWSSTQEGCRDCGLMNGCVHQKAADELERMYPRFGALLHVSSLDMINGVDLAEVACDKAGNEEPVWEHYVEAAIEALDAYIEEQKGTHEHS